MGQIIDSDALDDLLRILGLAAGSTAGPTLLDSGNVSLVLAVDQIVRRSRTPTTTTGSYVATLRNDHAAAGQLTTGIDPYNVGAFNFAPYPSPVPRGFDVWLLGAAIRKGAGAGTLDGAVLFIDPEDTQQAFGVDDSGVKITSSGAYPVALWTAFNTDITTQVGILGDGSVYAKIMLRLKSGASIDFVSDVAAAAVIVDCHLVLGLFPAGLGQDVAQ